MKKRVARVFSRGTNQITLFSSLLIRINKNPTSMSLSQQQEILDHTFKLLTDFCGGVSPKGSVAPWWETSAEGTKILLEKGVEYGLYRRGLYACHV